METPSSTSPLFSLPSHGRWRGSDMAPFIAAWRSSGQSLAGFCRTHGVDAMRVRYHVRAMAAQSASASVNFIEMRPLASSSPILISLASGVTVSVTVSTDLSLLRAVVDALR